MRVGQISKPLMYLYNCKNVKAHVIHLYNNIRFTSVVRTIAPTSYICKWVRSNNDYYYIVDFSKIKKTSFCYCAFCVSVKRTLVRSSVFPIIP